MYIKYRDGSSLVFLIEWTCLIICILGDCKTVISLPYVSIFGMYDTDENYGRHIGGRPKIRTPTFLTFLTFYIHTIVGPSANN